MQTSSLRQPRFRRGSIYIAVIGVALLVSIIGVTAMHSARVELERVQGQHETDYARSLAQSSVEFALGRIDNDVNWRSTYTHNVEVSATPTGVSETFSFRLLDNADGDLLDDATEPVEIQGIGRYGDATYVYSVTYEETISPDSQYGPLLLASYDTGGGADATVIVNSTVWIGQYFIPDLPAEAVEWSISSIDVLAKKNDSTSGTLNVRIYTADGGGMPLLLVESNSVHSSQLSTGTYDWATLPFTTTTGLSPGVGVCIGLEGTSSTEAVDVLYESYSVVQLNSHLISGGGGSWTAYDDGQAIYYRVRGFYATSSGGSSEFQITTGSWQREYAP